MQNYTSIKDENRSTVRTDQLPICEGNNGVDNSDAWLLTENSLPVDSHWTSMGTDIDSSADCEYGTSVSEEQHFHHKLITASERVEKMQEKMDDLEAKFQEITKYLQENPASENEIKPPVINEWHRQLNAELRDHLSRKLVSAILPSSCLCEDRIMRKLDAYSRKVENEIWETASSKFEYYHMLAEKYYKMHKEVDERRKRRITARRK